MSLFGPGDLHVPTAGWICLHCGTVWPADVFPCPIDGCREWKVTGPLYGSAIGTTQYGPSPGREWEWPRLSEAAAVRWTLRGDLT